MGFACLYLFLLFVSVIMDPACLADLMDDYNNRFDSDERMEALSERSKLLPEVQGGAGTFYAVAAATFPSVFLVVCRPKYRYCFGSIGRVWEGGFSKGEGRGKGGRQDEGGFH